ncbi:MAG: cobalamin-dependent protein [Candidatus Ancaeobacter aquaticus]|nr:cobalamin-dependent protein [Candidatus Ancaeobacter aquaticus]
MRLLFAHLRDNGMSPSFIGFKRMHHKPTKTLKNEFIEMNDFYTEVSEEDINTLVTQLEIQKPSLIGIGLKSSQYAIAQQVTQAIRARLKVPVIWGGPHPTIDPENCIKHTDMICVGEGAEALLELSQRISEEKPYHDVRNIWVNDNGNIIRNERRPLLTNLDGLAIASYDGDNKIYIDDGKLQPTNNIDYFGYGFTDEPFKTMHQTMTAYDCPMKCSFCINSVNSYKYRRRSVSHVIEELVRAKKKNLHLKMVFFWDDIFQIDKKWCLDFAAQYKKKVNLPFFTYSHPLYVNEEISIALRKAGWMVTVMGIQSGCEKLRKEIYDRDETNEHILKSVKILNKVRKTKRYLPFRIYYDYVKNNPLEGRDELRDGLNLFMKIPKEFIFQAFNLSFFPNYKLTKIFLERKLITEENIEGTIGTSATNWITTFDSKMEYKGFLHMHEYYYLLLSLTQFKYFPNSLIKKIEEKNLFYDNLRTLYRICKVVRIVDLYTHPTNYIWMLGIFLMVSFTAKIKHGTFLRHR